MLDKEVFAVLTGIVTVFSVAAGALLIMPGNPKPFLSIGILNSQCRIGGYPETVAIHSNLSLCIFLYNGMNNPVLLQVRYKLGVNGSLPTDSSPSPNATLRSYIYALDKGENVSFPVNVPIDLGDEFRGKTVALIFELWKYSPSTGNWTYTGRWVDIFVRATGET